MKHANTRSSMEHGTADRFAARAGAVGRWLMGSERGQITTVFGLGLVVRLLGLSVWPDIQFDEGLWTNSTRNAVEFDDWFMDGATHLFLSPLFHFASFITFSLASPSLWAARLVSALCGAASVPLLYGIVRRASGRHDLAMIAAILLAFNYFSIVVSRQAMIESTEIAMVLASVYFLVRAEWRLGLGVVAGAFFGLALLAKVNVIFMAPVLTLYLLWPRDDVSVPQRLAMVAIFGIGAAAVAGSVYGGLYVWQPERFVGAFTFELEGAHFMDDANPILRVGRFGLDPVKAAESIISLFRLMPFVMSLASLGLPLLWKDRSEGLRLFAPWILLGVPFYLLQLFQPVRYFYLAMPAMVYLGALSLLTISQGFVAQRMSGWIRHSAIAVFVAYGIGYSGMSFVANRGVQLQAVVAWMRDNTEPSDNVMAAAHFSTDIPRRTYGHYDFARTPEQLAQSIERLNISYIVYDADEWRPDVAAFLAATYPRVAEWSFGAVYRTDQTAQVIDALPAR